MKKYKVVMRDERWNQFLHVGADGYHIGESGIIVFYKEVSLDGDEIKQKPVLAINSNDWVSVHEEA